MGRNEIRLRRHTISSGRIARHRNYGELMERHEKGQKIKRIARLIIYMLIIAFILILLLIVKRWEQEKTKTIQPKTVSLNPTYPFVHTSFPFPKT